MHGTMLHEWIKYLKTIETYQWKDLISAISKYHTNSTVIDFPTSQWNVKHLLQDVEEQN